MKSSQQVVEKRLSVCRVFLNESSPIQIDPDVRVTKRLATANWLGLFFSYVIYLHLPFSNLKAANRSVPYKN